MNIENSRIAKNTIFLYLRTIVVLVMSLYTSRVILKSLGIEDFGIYNVVGGVVAMFVFVNGAMSAATLRFITFDLGRQDYNRLKVVFSTSILIHVGISLIVVLLAETVGLWFLYYKMIIPPERLYAANVVYQLSIFTAVVSILNVPYNSLMIAHERMSAFAYISILDAILKLLIAIEISFYSYDRLIFYSFLTFVSFVIVITIYYIYCYRSFPESHFHYVRDRELIVKMSKFAFWNLFSNFAFVTYTQGLNILLNVFFGPVVNAARGIAVQVQQAVCKFVDSFQSALNPQITKSYAKNDQERLLFLIDTSSRYSFYLVLLLIFPILSSIEYILTLWLGIVPNHTSNFVRLTLLAQPFSVLVNPLNIATQATGRVKQFFFVTGSLQLLILPLAYVSLKMGGSPEAVYIVYVVHVFFSSFIYMYITCSKINISMYLFLKKVVVKAYMTFCLASIIPIVYNLYVPSSVTFGMALLNMAIAELSIIGCIFAVGTTKNERRNLYFIIEKKMFNKFKL